jgi:uncharacterized protein (TIGR02246 family)
MRLAVALGLVLASASAFAQNSDAEQQIRAIIAGFSDIWARADLSAFENLLTEDADWVVRGGTFLEGRPHVVAHHARLLAGNFSGSRVSWQTLGVRFVRSDVAIAHVAAEAILQDGTNRNGIVTLVFVKGADRWRITAVQNTDRTSQ